MKSFYDVAVLGGGPAGVSASCWASDLGMKAVLIDAGKYLGGQLLWTYNPIRNHLGFEAQDGKDLAAAFSKQAGSFFFDRKMGAAIIEASLAERKIRLEDSSEISARFIVIATGVSRRKLGLVEEGRFYGRGIIESGKRDAQKLAGKKACIVGGGDAALENALIISGYAESATLIHRRSEFKARREFIGQVEKRPGIEVMLNRRVLELRGKSRLEGLLIENLENGEHEEIEADALIIRIGVGPNSSLFAGQADLDGEGYIKRDSNFETNLEGVFAVGDVANPVAKTISTAIGEGAAAAKIISERFFA